MKATKLDFLATLFGLTRGQSAPGDYEEDADLARRIQVAARLRPSRQAIATMGIQIQDAGAGEGRQVTLRSQADSSDPTVPNTDGNPAASDLACVFCDRAGRVRVAGYAPECNDCASSWEDEPGKAWQEG